MSRILIRTETPSARACASIRWTASEMTDESATGHGGGDVDQLDAAPEAEFFLPVQTRVRDANQGGASQDDCQARTIKRLRHTHDLDAAGRPSLRWPNWPLVAPIFGTYPRGYVRTCGCGCPCVLQESDGRGFRHFAWTHRHASLHDDSDGNIAVRMLHRLRECSP